MVVAVEVSPDEVVDLGLGGGVHVLELVHCLELDNIKTIWENTIRLVLEQMFALVGHDVENSHENVGAVGRRVLDAVAVVDAALAGLMVDVEVLEVVVKVDGAGAEVAAEEGGMGGKDSGDVDVSLAAEGDGEAGLPFVEVGDNGAVELARDVLWSGRVRGCERSMKNAERLRARVRGQRP